MTQLTNLSDTTVSELTTTDYPAWDNYVANKPNTPAYLCTAWKLAVESGYGHKTHYLVARSDNNVVQGVLPLVHLRKPTGSSELCSLPFCDLGGPIADNPIIAQQLIKAAISLQQQLKANHLELRQSEESSENRQLTDEQLTGKKVRMLLTLPSSAEALFAGFKSKLRSQIRKAEKNGLTVELGRTPELLEQFYQVFCRNMRDLGSPVHSRAWFNALLQSYGSNLIISVVRLGENVAGAGIVLFNGNVASIPWASTNAEYNNLAPNMLLYWSLLSYAADNHCSQFDFGRSTFGEGTFRFKKQWGAEPLPLNWQNWSLSGEATTQGTQSSKMRSLVTTAWQHLPLAVANSIGPRIRRYISL